MPSPQPHVPSKDAFQRLLDGLQTLIREHLALLQAEVKADLRGMGRDFLVGAAGVPALIAGYVLLMMAVAWLVSLWMPVWAAFGLVALVNLAVGGVVTYFGLRKIMAEGMSMPSTGAELQRDKAWLSSLEQTTRANGDGRLPLEGAARHREV